MKTISKILRVTLFVCGWLAVSVLGAVQPRKGAANEKFFYDPSLFVPEQTRPLGELDAATLASLGSPMQALGIASGHVSDVRVVLEGTCVGAGVLSIVARDANGAELAKLTSGNVLRVLKQAETVAARLKKSRKPSNATIEELDHSIQESSDYKIQVRLKKLTFFFGQHLIAGFQQSLIILKKSSDLLECSPNKAAFESSAGRCGWTRRVNFDW